MTWDPSPFDPADVRRRLFSVGERLGWQFRDRHHFWQHWPATPPPQRPVVPSAVSILLWIALGVYALFVLAITFGVAVSNFTSRTSSWPTVTLGWLILAGALAGLLFLTRGASPLRHSALVRRWERDRDTHNTAERSRVDMIDEWGAVRTLPGTRRIDVYGGEHQGWTAFLTTFGSSALAEGAPMIVLDLSLVGVSDELCQVAREAGVEIRVELLPDRAGVSMLLEDLSPADLKDVLVEAVHGGRADQGRDDRVLDDRILTAVIDVLGSRPTLPRIHEALRALLAEPGLRPVHLTEEELSRTRTLFADEHLRRLHDRVQRLEAYLAQIARLSDAERSAPPAGTGLTCFSVTASGSQVTTELVVELLGQWLIRNLKNALPGQGRRTVVVAGADRLQRHHLEQVASLCDARDFRLVLLFQHLRDAGADLLGGGRATVFMRLGNHEEAERAANFIGRGYRFELARITTEKGGSDTNAQSKSRGGERFSPFTRVWGSSRSRAQSTSWSYAEMRERVYELYVEPTHLQSLPPTALVLVQHSAGQRVLAVAADCDPDIASLPRVSMTPLLAEPTTTAELPQLPAPAEDRTRAKR